MDLTLSEGQYNLVYNSFSFVIAAMGAALIFFLLVRSRVAPRHRMAITLSTLVVAVAAYHYFRIFNSWSDAFTFVADLAQQKTERVLVQRAPDVRADAKPQTRELLVVVGVDTQTRQPGDATAVFELLADLGQGRRQGR